MTSAFQEQPHGGRLAWGLDQVLDLSVNVNPYGPSAELIAHLRTLSFREYPDPSARRLREELAHRWGERPENFLVGNGANELLWAIARACLPQQKDFTSAVYTCIEPCYSEFDRAARVIGARPAPFKVKPELYGAWSEDELCAHIDQEGTQVLYLCNPNSPTGIYLQTDFIASLLRGRPHLTIVLDESFLSLSLFHEAAARIYPDQVIRIVSLTKDFALAGLRIGYARGSAALIARLAAQIPTWSVNTLAQAAGIWCLQHEDFLTETRQLMLGDAEQLQRDLLERNTWVSLLPNRSSTIFTMLAVPDASTKARILLEKHRVLVRSCASYGYPEYWRIAVRPEPERKVFLAALDSLYDCETSVSEASPVAGPSSSLSYSLGLDQ